jgi:hypothetical protein
LFVNLLTTFAYLPTSLLYIYLTIWYRPGVITDEAMKISQKVWAIMGFLDSVAGVMQSLAMANLASQGGLVVLLLQSAIPSSMVITRIFLKVKYIPSQYFGAFIVIVGIFIALIPQLSNVANGGSGILIWCSVLVASCIPMCLSSVYKEKHLGDVEIDAIYLNYWVAVWQFVLSFPLLIPMAYASGITVPQLPSSLWNGLRCYVGISSQDGDDCGLAPIFCNVYILFNLGYNILIILMLKYGSSNILWLCITLQVPIANLAFALPFVGSSYQPLNWESIVGLVVIMTGLCVYRFFKQIKQVWRKVTGAKASSRSESQQSSLLSEGELDE